MAKKTASRRRKSSKSSSPGLISSFLGVIQAYRTEPEKKKQVRVIGSWSLIFFCLLSLIACTSYYFTGDADQSAEALAVNNWLGFVGAKLAEYFVLRGFGIFSFILILYGLLVGLVWLEDDYYWILRKSLKYVAFTVIFGAAFLGYIEILSNAYKFDLGGGVGHAINNWFIQYVGRIGVGFVLLFALLLFVVLNFNAEVRASRMLEALKGVKLPQMPSAPQENASTKRPSSRTGTALKQKMRESGKKKNAAKETTTEAPAQEQPTGSVLLNPASGTKQPAKSPTLQTDQGSIPLELPKETKSRKPKVTPPSELELTIVEPADEPMIEVVDNRPSKVLEQIGEDNIGKVIGEEKVEKIVPLEDQTVDNPDDLFEAEDYDPTLELSNYEAPPFELLEDHGAGRNREVDREELEQNKNKILQTLLDYGIKITSIKATIGPTVTLYEIVPAPGIRISKIKNLEDDIALSLAALGIRIIAPIPGKVTIGIEVPNSKPEVVSLRGVMTTPKFINTKAELPIAIGRTISNEVYIADLNKMPHLLIAGATGQGKSVGLNTVIASLLYKKHPAEIKFVLIDPKKVEMNLYQAMRHHFLAQLPDQGEEPIVTDVRDAVHVLKSLCVEMDQRYDLLKKARVRNLKEYNTKFTARKLSPRKGHHFLPYIVLVVDELADMMMTAGKEVEMPIARLAQLARAVGIHLVIATQRPSVNVITGIIKANFPARMSYRVISKVDSRTILDANGADQLIGRGDLLLSTGSDLIRIQNAFIDTPEVERIVDHIARQRGFPEPYFLPELPTEDSDDNDLDEPFEKDSRFEEAARLIVRFQIGSASLIQRKMKLGYNRAGRIIDQLERARVVGPHSGSKARDVLISDEAELERYLSEL
ncbi:MAG: DNA translocase FtsK [Bacteroidota bacterium]